MHKVHDLKHGLFSIEGSLPHFETLQLAADGKYPLYKSNTEEGGGDASFVYF
jgi:hypothetical protein